MKIINFIKNNILIIFILISAILLLSININKKFIGHHDWNSVVYSNIARNYLKYGYLITKLGQVRNFDIEIPAKFNYVTHYPPLLPILISLSFRLFGINEVAARIVPICASILMLIFIYLIGRNLYNKDVGFLAVLFTIITPLFIYFGKLPVHETVIPAFSLMVYFNYIKFIKTQKQRYYYLIILMLIIGGLVNWSNFYIIPPIILHYFIFYRKQKNTLEILSLVGVCMVVFGLQLLHIFILTGNLSSGGLIEILLMRTNLSPDKDIFNFSLFQYLKTEFQYFKIYFTYPLLVFSLIWFINFINQCVKNKIRTSDAFLMILFIYGMTCLIIFSNLSFIHDYMIYYLLPFIGLCSAVTLFRFRKWLSSTLFSAVVLFVVLISAFSQFKFTKALLEGDMNYKAWQIGTFINQNLPSGRIAFITSDNYKEFYEVFIGYYSDRRVGYGENLNISNIKIYDMIIRPKAHDALNYKTKKYLDQNLKKHEDINFIWYFPKNE